MKPTLILSTAFAIVLSTGSATAATIVYGATLTGAAERPTPVVTPATGSAVFTYDDVSGAWSLTGNFSNLTANANNAHIHGPITSGEVASPFVNLTFTAAQSGTLSGSGTFTPAQLAALATPGPSGLAGGGFYVNVHSVGPFSGGEIRGTLVPEPGTAMLAGLAGLTLFRRRR
ncbi:MAG TPA: CHRD domain-containing protein [Verrucomicrobiales bacterium]|nr:CHRD domain-containing protein [Verrucomicrobiales bacterium]